MRIIKPKLRGGLLALAWLIGMQTGWAIVVGPNPGGGATPNPETVLSFSGSVYHALPSLSDPPNYILPDTVVDLNPAGPYWIKHFEADNGNGAPDVSDRPVIRPGDYLIIKETLTVGGTEYWNDWHETVVQEGWSWVNGAIYHPGTNNLIDGFSFALQQADPGDVNFENIHFAFDPLLPGTTIDVIKILQFQGGFNTPSPNDNWGSDPITTRQFPTQTRFPVIPEPATLGLLALGAGMLGLIRRRKRVRRA